MKLTMLRTNTPTRSARIGARIVHLSIADQGRIAEMLASPPTPNNALKQAFAVHRQLIRNS